MLMPSKDRTCAGGLRVRFQYSWCEEAYQIVGRRSPSPRVHASTSLVGQKLNIFSFKLVSYLDYIVYMCPQLVGAFMQSCKHLLPYMWTRTQ